MNYECLFDFEIPRSRFETLESELHAIRDDQKEISLFAFPSRGIRDDDLRDPTYDEVTKRALHCRLTVTHYQESSGAEICVFVHKNEATWRIPALIAIRNVIANGEYGWAESTEYLESLILGYSSEEIKAWFDRKRMQCPSMNGTTIYLLLNERQISSITTLGMRAFMPDSLAPCVTALRTSPFAVVQKDASRMIPPEDVLARIAVKYPCVSEVFGEHPDLQQGEVAQTTVGPTHALMLNRNLRSNIQLLNNGQWQ